MPATVMQPIFDWLLLILAILIFARFLEWLLIILLLRNTTAGYLKWKEYMNSFGMGVRLGVDLPSEDYASVPDTSRYNRDFGGSRRWNSCNIVTLGIGQDRMTATPLQMANVMSIIANRGYYYTPHFIDSIQDETIDDTAFLGKIPDKTYGNKYFKQRLPGCY